MKTLLCLLLSLTPFVFLHAQDTDVWQHYLETRYDADDADSDDMQALSDLLYDLHAHPIDLNHTSYEELAQLPFLDEQQLDELVEYLDRYAPVRSLGELMMLRTLTPADRQLLCEFITIDTIAAQPPQPSVGQLLSHAHHELTATARVPFYQRKGDEKGYLGYPFRHSLRYTLSNGQHLKAGLIGAQDASEPFFANRNKWGYDYYTFFFQLRRKGALRNLVAGRYRASFGMGLVMNSNFSLGKTTVIGSLGRTGQQLSAHSSTMMGNYLQGAGATIALGAHWELTPFLSWRTIDATLNDEGAIATRLTSGYHRTESELQRKDNASELLGGVNVNWKSGRWQLGMTAVYNRFSKPLQPNTSQRYRRYYPQGQQFWNASAHYSYTSPRLSIKGETATGQCKALATSNLLAWKLSSEWSLMALQRFFSYHYYALHAKSFSEGSSVQNESGLYIGTQWRPNRQFTLLAYADVAYFPWARYLASRSSYAFDHLLQASWQHRRFTLDARYRLHIRQRDRADKQGLYNRTEHRMRLNATLTSGAWTLRTKLDATLCQTTDHSHGWMLTQQARWQKKLFDVDVSAAYFHTTDYDSRVYGYERGMRYAFSFPMFYGEGLRWALSASCRLGSRLRLTAKCAGTHYLDRSTIGSGLQAISSNHQIDFDAQLTYKL